jgi:hypothetical protein
MGLLTSGQRSNSAVHAAPSRMSAETCTSVVAGCTSRKLRSLIGKSVACAASEASVRAETKITQPSPKSRGTRPTSMRMPAGKPATQMAGLSTHLVVSGSDSASVRALLLSAVKPWMSSTTVHES